MLVTSLALLSTTIVFGILIRWSFFDIETESEYQFIKYFFIGSTLLLWLLEIRLELTAKKKAEDLYQIQMNEYEIMRTKWLEIASRKMEIDAKRSMEPMKTVPTAQVVVQPTETETSLQKKPSEEN